MSDLQRKNRRLFLSLVVLAMGMVGLAYVSVPLYSLFCKLTGFGGTPQIAENAVPSKIVERSFRVEFNADTNAELPWDFAPEQRSVEVRAGEQTLVAYRAHNRSDKEVTGTAVFNITPEKAASYFIKTQCFCFEEQTLKAGATADLPVSFFIDPDIVTDPNLNDVSSITLSYTFYPAKTSGG